MSAVSGSETEQALVTQGVKPLAVPRRLLRMRSDAALAERFALGDEAAFDVIYERHRPVVLAVCMGVLGTPPDAEDATQETFSALAVALRTRPPAELRPWLIRVARNASIDTTRRRRHRLLTLDGEIPEVAARPAGGGQAELAVVLDGIRELPEGQRMALLMRELGGHSYAEIAEFLATDEEAVKGLIARARVGLRTYREATELSCATARGTISAEPDGRRYDKTIRRHLRGCASCRGYRDALRDDAKALRAALPIQAGTVATGSLSSGMLSAAKGSLLGYGLTQAATTCAASACAVGAIGGMVFVAPVHKLGLPPILPITKSSAVHRHVAVRAPAEHAAVPASHTLITVSHSTAPAASTEASTADRAALTHGAVAHHSHHVKVTRVSLPALPKHHRNRPAATNNQATPSSTTSVTTQTTEVQSSSTVTPAAPQSATQPAQTQAAQSSQPADSQAVATSPSQGTTSGGGQSSSQGGLRHGNGQGNGGGNGNPPRSPGAASGGGSTTTTTTPTTTSPTSTTPTSTTPTSTTPTSTTPTSTTPTTTTPTTTSPSTTPPGYGHGNHGGNGGQQGSRHGGNGRPGTTTQSTATPSTATQSTTTTQPSATTTTTPASTTTTSSSSGGSNGWGSHGWGSGSHGGHGWGH
jgi:RNA polymerase sigma factor (sigma-70 family)